MVELKTEYTDIKGNKHKVGHLTVVDNSKELILEELFIALTRPSKRISA